MDLFWARALESGPLHLLAIFGHLPEGDMQFFEVEACVHIISASRVALGKGRVEGQGGLSE